VDRIWEGTSEIQRMIIANEVSKRGLDQLVTYGSAGAASTNGSAGAAPAAAHA
jgi:hypothetical protein